MVVTKGETDCEPNIAFAPDHPPDATQESALAEDQVSVQKSPEIMEEGEAVMETVGGTNEGVQLS